MTTTIPETQLIKLGRGSQDQFINLRYANRHGLICGATGSGKTVTLQLLAENFARSGVTVFVADVKGDLSGISQPGVLNEKLAQRAQAVGIADFQPEAQAVTFWDVLGTGTGHPLRATISDFGPILMSRLLGLNDTQEGVLNVVFRYADDEGLLLLDLKDLRSVLTHVQENAKAIMPRYGNITAASVGAVQRQLLILEQQGADQFFGEPSLDINDLLRPSESGRARIHVLNADKLVHQPQLYATVLFWLMSELFEELPELGDTEKPKLVFFFDEAHLLFSDSPDALIKKLEQVVRLIRSKGVGIYFISQNPLDVPDEILGQLGNRIQHVLRAYTPRDQKAVRAAAETFRANPRLNVSQAITELAVGEALVSTLGENAIPAPVERIMIAPPRSRIGPITSDERNAILANSPYRSTYDEAIDRESAHEMLTQRTLARTNLASQSRPPGRDRKTATATNNRDTVVETLSKNVVRSLGSNLGRSIARGLLGSILKGLSR